MKVIGKDIGGALDAMYADLAARVEAEASAELQVAPFEGGAFSSVEWEPGVVVILLHNGVPRRALGHVFGVALQHVRQRLDHYPAVLSGPQDFEGGDLVRTTLRELVMAPEAEQHLAPLNLDTSWETQQRHEGLKQLLRDAPMEWNSEGTFGHAFSALQYARFSIDHPPELWATLIDPFKERLPAATEAGERLAAVVREHGWATADACLASLVAARDVLELAPFALVEDLRDSAVV